MRAQAYEPSAATSGSRIRMALSTLDKSGLDTLCALRFDLHLRYTTEPYSPGFPGLVFRERRWLVERGADELV